MPSQQSAKRNKTFPKPSGSIGISLSSTLVTRHSQIHRLDLSRYLTPTRILRHGFYVPHGLTLFHLGPQLAQLRQYAMLANGLDIQATVYSYVDDLRYMAVASVLCAPIVFAVRGPKRTPGASP